MTTALPPSTSFPPAPPPMNRQDDEFDSLIFGKAENGKPNSGNGKVESPSGSPPPNGTRSYDVPEDRFVDAIGPVTPAGPGKPSTPRRETESMLSNSTLSDSKSEVLDPEEKPKSSIANVLPVDKLKNGAASAAIVMRMGFLKAQSASVTAWSKVKETEAFKVTSQTASQTATKVKSTDAFKMASQTTAVALEKTKQNAVFAGEKARQGAAAAQEKLAPIAAMATRNAAVGLEMAKASAAAGVQTAKKKVAEVQKRRSSSNPPAPTSSSGSDPL